MMSYIKVFLDASGTVDLLSDAEAGRLLKALLHYGNGRTDELPGQEKLVFAMLAAQIDRDNATYQSKADAARENGRKGGRPKNQSADSETDSVSEKPSGFSSVSTETEKTKKPQDKDKDKDKEEDKDKDKDKDDDEESTVRKRAQRFTPPTVDEVREYVIASGYRIDPERFIAYYESNGWRVGRNPMRDWKAAVRTWVRNGYENGGGNDGQRGGPSQNAESRWGRLDGIRVL